MTPFPCVTQPDRFFPETPTGRQPRSGPQVEAAKRICRTCPNRTGCLIAGMFEEYGIWGGLTPAERHALITTLKLRRSQAIPAPWTGPWSSSSSREFPATFPQHRR